MKEIVLRIDDHIHGVMHQETQAKRSQGACHALSEKFLIRLLDAMANNSKVLQFNLQDGKFVVRSYNTLKNDDDRQVGGNSREADRTSPQLKLPVQE